MFSRTLGFALLLSALGAAGGCGGGDDPATGGDGGGADGGGTDGGPGGVDAGPGTDGGPSGGDEFCDNGLDDDGDGVIDEDCFCVPGQMAPCFGGTADQRLVGACADGAMVCEDGLEFGTWGICTGDVRPETEVCEDVGVDEDCDGAVNEGCDCDPTAPPVACGSDVGECAAGAQACLDGMLGECTGAVGPTAETCNGLDDDCDGEVDEALTRGCGTGTGECRRGTQTCVGGTWEACSGGRGPADEACDGLDNDCDGDVDEALSRACGTDVGACDMGSQSCSGGSWSMCTGGTTPTVETCNDADDDCDGTVDESITRTCGSDVGACSSGTETCTRGSWGSCAGAMGPGMEVCDGAVDEDCDGAVDEGCTCTTGATRPCGTDTGVCSRGTQTCGSGGWGACTGEVGPMPETCNMLDDDCDGAVDEGGICPTSPPIVMCPADITADVLTTVTLAGGGSDPDGGPVTFMWTVLTRPTGSSATPSPPTNPTASFFLDASGSYVLQLCATDDEGETACCTVNVTSNAPGVLHVEMSWDTAYGDADLHLLNVTRTPPDGWYTADDCFFANIGPDWGPAGAAANPTLDRDDTDGYGPENVTINTAPGSGSYNIGVHYYCSHSIGAGAAPGDGPTDATVRVYCMGSLIATYSGIRLSSTDDFVTVATVDYPSCVGRSVDTRTNGSSILPPTITNAVHCEISCTSDSDCPSGERCASVVGPGGRREACVLR